MRQTENLSTQEFWEVRFAGIRVLLTLGLKSFSPLVASWVIVRALLTTAYGSGPLFQLIVGKLDRATPS